MNGFDTSLNHTNLLLLGFLLLVAMGAAATLGAWMRRPHTTTSIAADDWDGSVSYIVSAVLGLLALLMGFTFSLAADRFDARRLLVLNEANAIGTTYLRAQLLQEPHRARMSALLVRYTENRIALAKAAPDSGLQHKLLAQNDVLITDIWAATSAAFPTIQGVDFSSTYLDSVNALIDLDASRKAARAARVPTEVFAILLVYMITAAGVLGYALKGAHGRWAAGFLLALLTLSLMLIIDINRPTRGGTIESQQPMEALWKSFATPTAVFDKWKQDAG